jgi:uncharacterized protein YcbK (DUF882 family)
VRISEHFIRSEFACRCHCGFNCVDSELVKTLEKARAYFNDKYPDLDIRCEITSGNRCKEYNDTIPGASDKSMHTKGMAADHYFYKNKDLTDRIPAQEIYDYYCSEYPDWFGIGLYSNRVHLDTRSRKARWKSL